MREEVCGGKFSALAERELLRDVLARIALHPSRLKDEPRQSFINVQFFERGSLYLVIVFRRAMRGFFVIRFFKKAVMPIARKRRAMTGFYKSTVF